MNKYLSMALFATLVTLQPITAKGISINEVVTPKMQLKAFPITKSFLFTMSETMSNNRKFLVVAYDLSSNKKKLQKAISLLRQKNIPYKVLSKKVNNQERNYIYIDAQTSSQAFIAIHDMENIGMSVKVGKNLLPSDIISKESGTFFAHHKKEDIFSNDVQNGYLIQRIQNLVLECFANKHLLESVVESYMNDLFGRDSIDITGEPKMIENEVDGRMEYAPAFVSEFGTTICNCDYSEVISSKEYKDTSFYQAFQDNHKRLFGEAYDFESVRAEVDIKPLKLSTNKAFLQYFNSSFLSDAYSQKELKYTTNSKGVTIFCVSGNDGLKLCKTKKEILQQISLQNKILY